MSVGMGEQLLPGIIDDITLELIVPKLSWRDLYVMRSVSPTWQQAIQTRVIYESRVRSKSTEKLVIVGRANHYRSSYFKLFLYSLTDDTWTKLPSNHYFTQGIRDGSHCISLDGKLYVLGGFKDSTKKSEPKIFIMITQVYVLDLAGQRPWKKCADMLQPRQGFGCGAINGKIYVFGGSTSHEVVLGCDVYDPKVNTWSRVKPMMTSRVGHHVFKLGHELFVYGGREPERASDGSLFWTKPALSLEAYNPVKDEWKLICELPFGSESADFRLFTAQGNIYATQPERSIGLFDIDKQSWASVQPCIYATGDFHVWSPPVSNIVVDNEFLGISGGLLKSTGTKVTGILRGKGFGKEKEDMVLKYVSDPFSEKFPVFVWTIEI